MKLKMTMKNKLSQFMKIKNTYDYYTENFSINIKQHQCCNYELLEIIQYILNKTNYKDKIKDGILYNESLV